MSKEHFKSFILAILLICNLFLANRILVNKKLWPNGYNFFVMTKNTELYSSLKKIFHRNSGNDNSKSHILSPNNIIVNTGYQSTRLSLKLSDEKYTSVYSACLDILKNTLSQMPKSWSYADEQEWNSALSGRSVYLSYASVFNISLFESFMGVNSSDTSIITENIKGIVISSGINPSVYIKGETQYYKCSVELVHDALGEMIDSFQESSINDSETDNSMINYSFELLFDKALENQRTVIDSMIPIYNSPISYFPIVSENPIQRSDGSIDYATVNKVLSIFNINSNSIRRYTESGGTMVFVENSGTLKIYTNGFIEYNSNSDAYGIHLINSSAVYDNMCAAADFMDNVNSTVDSNKNMILSSQNLSVNSAKGIRLTFDYSVDGMPVNITGENTTNAVCIEMKNGYLTHYSQLLRSYKLSDKEEQAPLYIEDLDRIIEDTPNNVHTYINKMYLAYKDDSSIGTKLAGWIFEKEMK